MKSYTEDQVKVMLVEQKSQSMEKSIDKISMRLDSIEATMKSQFHMLVGFLVGLYGLCISGLIAAICKAYGVL